MATRLALAPAGEDPCPAKPRLFGVEARKSQTGAFESRARGASFGEFLENLQGYGAGSHVVASSGAALVGSEAPKRQNQGQGDQKR
jgi:hypothetical protein